MITLHLTSDEAALVSEALDDCILRGIKDWHPTDQVDGSYNDIITDLQTVLAKIDIAVREAGGGE